MNARILMILNGVVILIALLQANSCPASQPPLKAALRQTPVAGTATPPPVGATRTPHPGMTAQPPANFDLSKFGSLSTATLPMADGKPIVARVNGRPVTLEEFQMQARLVGAKLLQQQPGQEASLYAALKEPVLDALVVQELYREYATSHSLVVQPAEVQRRRGQFLRASDQAVMAVASKLTADQNDQLVKDALIREKVARYIGDMATSAPPTRAAIDAFLLEDKTTTKAESITRARHLVIRATTDMSQFNVNDAEARTSEALEKIQQGLPFVTAVHEYSQDRFSAEFDGNIGYFAKGMMYPEFEEAAAKLEPGQVSSVVRTPVGFHIIQVTDRQPNDLLLQVERQTRSLAVNHWLDEARNSVKLESYLDK